MITAKMLPYGVEISGHAGAGPHGHDLVCAAVSGLLMALVSALEGKGQVNTCEIRPGYALVTAFDRRCPYLDMMEAGLEAFSRKYPENIALFSCRQGRDFD